MAKKSLQDINPLEYDLSTNVSVSPKQKTDRLGVMAALEFLVLSVIVRIGVEQLFFVVLLLMLKCILFGCGNTHFFHGN